MKKNLILFYLLIFGYINAQIGIQTQNPQGMFHIDGSKDNALSGAPTIAQATNDFITLSSGNTGIGTVTPTNKLVVKGNNAQPTALGTTNTNAILRVDGNTQHSLDFGTFSNSPFGSYISSHNKFSTSGLPLVLNPEGGNVGIGTINPTAQLQTTGNMILGTAASTNSSAGYSPVARDNATGELKVINSDTGNNFPLNYLVYQLNNVNSDWVSDFNTNIPSSQYTLVIVGSRLNISSGGLQVTSLPGTFSPINIFSFRSGGTWHLSADYDGSNTANGSNANWTIYCVVINNSLIKSLPNVASNLGGTNTGSAPIPPGL